MALSDFFQDPPPPQPPTRREVRMQKYHSGEGLGSASLAERVHDLEHRYMEALIAVKDIKQYITDLENVLPGASIFKKKKLENELKEQKKKATLLVDQLDKALQKKEKFQALWTESRQRDAQPEVADLDFEDTVQPSVVAVDGTVPARETLAA